MVKVQHFSTPNFEKNIVQLGEKVEARKEMKKGEDLSERELVKESVQAWSSSLPSASVPSTSEGEGTREENGAFLPNYLGSEREGSVREALERLVGTVLHGDLEKALGEAKKMPPFLEDAFHDALVDKVVPEMKRRGLI